MIDASLEEILDKTGCLCTEIKGTSMNPLLYSGKNKVYIEKPTGRLKRMDVALYRRDNGDYILHRVMSVLSNGYVFCGDNHFVLEYGITDENILGVMKGYYSGTRYISVDKSFKYKLYVFFWASSLKFRRFLNLFRRINKKIKSN